MTSTNQSWAARTLSFLFLLVDLEFLLLVHLTARSKVTRNRSLRLKTNKMINEPPSIIICQYNQAFMEENADSSRFGLEVICHRSDRRLPELTNYKHRVGASLKPKLLKPGKILVRLKSQLFEADVEAGEDPEMVKEEYDFRGRDFEKQYACRFGSHFLCLNR